jgi:hypothetical protein
LRRNHRRLRAAVCLSVPLPLTLVSTSAPALSLLAELEPQQAARGMRTGVVGRRRRSISPWPTSARLADGRAPRCCNGTTLTPTATMLSMVMSGAELIEVRKA